MMFMPHRNIATKNNILHEIKKYIYFHTFLSRPIFTTWQSMWMTHECYFFPHCTLAWQFINFHPLLTASCSLLVSPGPRHYRTAARLGSHEPPPARHWPGSTQLSLPLWAGHLRGDDQRQVKSKGVKKEEREREVKVWCKVPVWI